MQYETTGAQLELWSKTLPLVRFDSTSNDVLLLRIICVIEIELARVYPKAWPIFAAPSAESLHIEDAHHTRLGLRCTTSPLGNNHPFL